MTRHEVPGGAWFDLKPLAGLTSGHQDTYLDLLADLRDAKREAALAKMRRENPAVEPDPDDVDVSLKRSEEKPLRDLLLSWTLEDSSFGVPLPAVLPIIAGNVLRQALQPYYRAMLGAVEEPPKEDEPETPTPGAPNSATTSSDTVPGPLPEAVPESSGTPAG